jgi:mannose-6-phosphate isomerase-like protein (cupin superfamily)|tara:strand:- start:2161 stop:2640 length:480 start_codon:yes stop_codon:yes gene_type:complete
MDEQTQLWIKRLKDEIQNHNRYEARQLFYIDDNGLDREVKEHMTYGEWLREFNRFKVIKVEGLEDVSWLREVLDEVVKNITGKTRQDIHLFVNQKPGVSFKSHKDDKDVYLYVVKGKKKVNMNNEVKPIYDDEGIIIKQGVEHFVESEADTWGLSIGVI